MTEHSKLPWEARLDGWQPWPGSIAIISADGEIIAYTTSGANEKINAALIVKAVSSHDALIAALRRIVSLDKENAARYAQSIAREALAKATA